MKVQFFSFIFIRSLISTRNVVERSYGVLKRRFPILHSGMQISRVAAIQKVICVCCILHNMCIDLGDVEMDDFENCEGVDDDDNNEPPPQAPDGAVSVGWVRNEIVAIFAQRLGMR